MRLPRFNNFLSRLFVSFSGQLVMVFPLEVHENYQVGELHSVKNVIFDVSAGNTKLYGNNCSHFDKTKNIP